MLTLPDTASLLIAGGDTRIVPDPATGLTKYGCRAVPDSEVVALGSSTASTISANGMAAAEALRQRCQAQLQTAAPETVYADQMQNLRAELLRLCGCQDGDGVNAVLAASGTDMHLIVTQWLRPQRTVMITQAETGSGLMSAVQGKHFHSDSACGDSVPIGALISDWQGDICMLAARETDGSLRDPATVDAECSHLVEEAASAGQKVLLILTDSSKTGLIFPGIGTVMRLQQRWPEQVEVLVDACQFRLAPATLQAFLAQQWMVALTGSKFLAGPTFSGALLVPSKATQRYRAYGLPPGVSQYSNAADWPIDFAARASLSDGTNFGLMLRWEAAMAELRAFRRVDEQAIQSFLQAFRHSIVTRLQLDPHFALMPVGALDRSELGCARQWDSEPTIFPFLLFHVDTSGRNGAQRRPLTREQTAHVYRQLSQPDQTHQQRRFQLGQPVLCGERDGIAVSALRLCISAPMIVAASDKAGADQWIANAHSALDRLLQILGKD